MKVSLLPPKEVLDGTEQAVIVDPIEDGGDGLAKRVNLLTWATNQLAAVKDAAIGAISAAQTAATSAINVLVTAATATLNGFVTSAQTAASAAAASAVESASNGIAQRGSMSRVVGLPDRFGYVFKSQEGLTLGGITLGGQLFAGLHPQSSAFGQLSTLVNTGLATGAFLTKSGLDRALGGTTYGDKLPASFNAIVRDAAGKAMFGTDLTGAGWQAKYSTRVAGAVRAAEGPACAPSMPIIDESGGAIVAYYGSSTVTLTSEGNSSKPRMLTDKVVFKNDRYRGVPAWYQMNYDGTSQRAVLRDVYLEGVLVTGQSLATPYTSSPGLSTTAPLPSQALMLTGGAIFEYPTVSSPTAALTGCKEPVAAEGIATRFSASVITNETPFRPNLKLVMFGCGYPSQPYTIIKKGTATYAEWLAQAARITALAGGPGKFIVRAVIIMHGEADFANASYDLNLIEWQANIEADIQAITGQQEPVYMFINQIGSLRALAPATPNTVKSPLLQLAASVANPKIIIAVPDYIVPYNADGVHPSNVGKRLLAEHLDKPYRKVISEGRDWRGVSPKAFTLGSDYVDIQFYVPVLPLVLDTAQCTDPGNYGFTYTDGLGRTITNVAVTQPDTVRVSLSGAIGTGAVLDFAYSNGTANKSGPTEGARGCLHDSYPGLSLTDGVTPLFTPCVVWRQALN